jgi:hypothetical protein
MVAQHIDGPRSDADRALRRMLRLGLGPFPTGHRHDSTHRDRARIEVDITPPQTDQLAASESCRQQHDEHGVQAVLADSIQERLHLLNRPACDRHRLVSWRRRRCGDVRCNHSASHGVVEDLMQHRVHSLHRFGRERLPCRRSVHEQIALEVIDRRDRQIADQRVAEPVADLVDTTAIRAQRRCSAIISFAFQPRSGDLAQLQRIGRPDARRFRIGTYLAHRRHRLCLGWKSLSRNLLAKAGFGVGSHIHAECPATAASIHRTLTHALIVVL